MSQDFRYQVGLGNVGSYQVSGKPYVTSSLVVPNSASAPLKIEFPYVSKFITVKNTHGSNSIRVGFSSLGVSSGTNYMILSSSESFTADLRVVDLYLLSNAGSAASAQVVAGLTGINRGELVSNWSGSDGIG